MKDPLLDALENPSRSRFFRRSSVDSGLFKQNSFDTDYLGLTFSQRISCFAVTFVIASFLFIHSVFNMFSFFFSPTKFAFTYTISNILFFIMPGFIFGFKSYFTNLLRRKKRNYTIAFLSSTILNIVTGIKIRFYIFNLLMLICQMTTFFMFMITFVPGGTNGINSMVKMFTLRFNEK